MQRQGVTVISPESRVLYHRSKAIKSLEMDLLAADVVILELKCIQSRFAPAHYAQIITYLKLWQKDLGLLVNFGLESARIQRVPFTEKTGTVVENYDYIKGMMTAEDRQTLRLLREAILNVHIMHGLGYTDTIYRAIVEAELDYLNLRFLTHKEVSLFYDSTFLKTYLIDHLLIEDRVLFGIRAIQDRVTPYDIAKTRTYLRALGLRVGLVVNFGKTGLQIVGVACDSHSPCP